MASSLVSRAGSIDQGHMPVNIVNGTHSQLIAFLVLNMWPAHFGLPILLATIFFSKKVNRHPTFVNMCIVWIIVGISTGLLAYAGKATGPEPSKMLCLLQASLVYGIPWMTSMSIFALVYQMFIVIRASYHGKEILESEHLLRLWILLIAPYAALVISILATAGIGAENPENISRSRRFFYCSVMSSPLTNTITIVASAILLATLLLEVWTVVILCKRYIAFRKQGLRLPMDLNLPLRIITFGFYVFLSLSLGFLSVKSPSSPVPDLVIAAAPSVVMLIFGTQPDILCALCFWRKEKPDKVDYGGSAGIRKEDVFFQKGDSF